MTTLNDSIQHLITALKESDEYRQTWQANLAMAYADCYHWHCRKMTNKLSDEDISQIANEAADYFLDLLTQQADAKT